MKRIWILPLAALMLFSFAAQAKTPDLMEIVNCEEWVSLRSRPSSAAGRYAQVPLGENVRGFYASHGEYSICEYEGAVGYILNEYLQAEPQDNEVKLPSGEPSYTIPVVDECVKVWYGFGDTGEILRLGWYDHFGNLRWSYQTESLMSTELSSVDVFVNWPSKALMVMVHNSSYGLIALDAYTGEEIWTLPQDEVSLGGSITHAVDEDGTMYIGGYYGPDPVCISPDGKVQWESSSLHDENGAQVDFCWLDDIVIVSDGIAAHYDNCGDPVWVGYDHNGKMISWEKDPV